MQLLKYSLDTCKLLYMFTDFQVSERLYRGPEFSHNLPHKLHHNYLILTAKEYIATGDVIL